MTKQLSVVLLLILALGASCFAQAQPQVSTVTPSAAPAKSGVWEVIADPDNIAPAAFLLSNVADARTDWRFTGPITHREYAITPAQRLGIAGGSIFAAYTVRHYFPKTSKPINTVLAVATAYFAGRAYANTFNHGTPTPPPVPAPATAARSLAFAVQLRR